MDWRWGWLVPLATAVGCGDFVLIEDTDGDDSAGTTSGPSTTDAPTSSSGGTASNDGTTTTPPTSSSSTDANETDASSSSDTAPTSSTSGAEAVCGDGMIGDGEDCDDENLDDHDGCSARCELERGFECVSEPSECGPASILVNGDFEDVSGGDPIVNGNTFPVFFPGTALWFADAGSFAPAEGGVSPRGGDRMLRFDATGAGPSGFSASNIQQAIDMAPFSTLIADGRVSLDASAYFNRVESADDSLFQLRIVAYAGSPKDGFTELGLADDEVFSDLDAGTWEELGAIYPLSTNTTFVLLSLDAIENAENDSSAPEFAGHYADDADVRIIVAPP